MSTRRKLATGAVVLAGCSFAGGAYAATNDTSPKQAFLNDVASRLHVSPAQLKSALHGAALDQLQAAVKAGRLTQAQANAIEQRMRDHRGLALPFFGFRHFRHLEGGPLMPAASYLGITEIQLLDQLGSGKSLAQIARAHGKSVAGLENALVGAARSKLDRLRAKGFITGAQEQRALSRLQARIAELVNRAGVRPRFGARLLPPPPGALMPAPAGPPPFGPPPLG
jgi:hypothetical protein